MKRRTTVVVTAVGALVLGLGGASTAFAVRHQDRALPRTSIAGVSVAGQTPAEIGDALQARAARVRITLVTPAGTRTASLADLGYRIDSSATAGQVLAGRDLGSYARALTSDQAFDPVVSSDPAVLRAFADGLVPADRVVAKSASVRLAADRESFEAVPAVIGASTDPRPIASAAAASAHDLTSRTVQVELRDVAPAVSTEQARALAARAESLVTTPVAVGIAGESVRPSTRERASWVVLPTAATGAPKLDAARISAWVRGRADAAAVGAVDGSRVLTSSGTVVRVTAEKVDGRTVTNAADVATALTASLGARKAFRGTFESTTVPAAWVDRRLASGAEKLAYQAVAGEKWIDVNLSKHTMTAYVGGKPALGPVAMVNGAPATPSLVGTHYVNRKYEKDRMRGSNADGSLYDTPDVPWVSYFQGGYALHGAPWRSTFGYAASHGCINLPVGTAKWVYDWAPIGTPVVSHF